MKCITKKALLIAIGLVAYFGIQVPTANGSPEGGHTQSAQESDARDSTYSGDLENANQPKPEPPANQAEQSDPNTPATSEAVIREGPTRIAILVANLSGEKASPDLSHLRSLLEAGLSQKMKEHDNVELVERARLDAILNETQINLALSEEDYPSDVRNRYRFLTADRLVLIQENRSQPAERANPAGQTETNYVIHVVDAATGLRLRSHPLNAGAAARLDNSDFIDELWNNIQSPLSYFTIFAVSPIADARLEATGNDLGRTLQSKIALALQQHNRIQLELAEAQALGTEMNLRGEKFLPANTRPWLILTRIADHPESPNKIKLRAVLQHQGVVVSDLELVAAPEDIVTSSVRIAACFSPLLDTADQYTAQDRRALVADLKQRAKQLRSTSQTAMALDLMETALLYDPHDDTLRFETLGVLSELIDRAISQNTQNPSEAGRSALRDATPLIHDWHERGLNHLWLLMLRHLEGRLPPQSPVWNPAYFFMQELRRTLDLPKELNGAWPEAQVTLEDPVTQRYEAFTLRVLDLIDSHDPAPATTGYRSLKILDWVSNPGRGVPQSYQVVFARISTAINLARRVGRVRDSILSIKVDAGGSPEYTVLAIDTLAPSIDEPWLRDALKGHRADAAISALGRDRKSHDYFAEHLKDTWPPGIIPAIDMPAAVDQWETIKRAANFSNLPEVRRSGLVPSSEFRHGADFSGMVSCGPLGDLVWTRKTVMRLDPRGKIHTLLRYAEPHADPGQGWVRNVSYDGSRAWVLLPGPATKLLLIDPESGETRTLTGAKGLPPSTSGGSVVCFAPDQGIAFGSFGEGVNVRTWYASIDARDNGFKVNILRSDKSVYEANESPLANNQLKAGHANRLAVSRSDKDTKDVRVIGELLREPHRKMGQSNNDIVQLVVINPQTGEVVPAGHSGNSPVGDMGTDWIVTGTGEIIYRGRERRITRSYDPFTDYERLLRPATRLSGSNSLYSGMQVTPRGFFDVLRLYGSGSDTALLCRAETAFSPPLPVAKMDDVQAIAVVGWSEHHGLVLVGDGLEAVSADLVDDLPEPFLDFHQFDETRHEFAFTEHFSRGGYKYAYIASHDHPGKGKTGLTYQEALAVSRGYGTTLLTREHIANARKLLGPMIIPMAMGERDLMSWTSLRAIPPANRSPDDPPTAISYEQLLPDGSEEGWPVAVAFHGLRVVNPNNRYAVILPFRLPRRNLAPERSGLVPRVVKIPAGTAWVGAPPETGPLAQLNPRREVTIPPGLFMMETELSDWQALSLLEPEVVDKLPRWNRNALAWSAYGNNHRPKIKAICQRLRELTGENWRLPTEDEWEYACRAGSVTAYASGDSVDGLRKLASCRYPGQDGGFHFIRQHQPNAWGLYDMHGGAPETVIAGSSPADFERWLAGTYRPTSSRKLELVMRGGSYADPPEMCRSYSRAAQYGLGEGIRLVLDRTQTNPDSEPRPNLFDRSAPSTSPENHAAPLGDNEGVSDRNAQEYRVSLQGENSHGLVRLSDTQLRAYERDGHRPAGYADDVMRQATLLDGDTVFLDKQDYLRLSDYYQNGGEPPMPSIDLPTEAIQR